MNPPAYVSNRSSSATYSSNPPSELPMSCMYSHRMNGFFGLSERYCATSSGVAYMRLSTSEITPSYARQLNTPS